PRNVATRPSIPPTSTTGAPATCASTIYCHRGDCRSAAAVCSGRPAPTRTRAWYGATNRPRAPITGWYGSTSVQTELDAHRAMIPQPVRLRVLVVEHHAHEGLADHRGSQLATQQDVVDVLVILAVGRAGRELAAAGDVGELRIRQR